MKKTLCAGLLILGLAAPAGAAQTVTDENLTQILREILREKPELILDVLREHSESVLDIAQQGSTQRRKRTLEAQWREDLKTPKSVNLAGRPVLGPANAPITVVEFSDFTCPYCEQAATNLKKIMDGYGNSVRLIFKHMPLGKEGPSRLASEYVAAAGLQNPDKAWKLYEACFSQREQLSTKGEDFLKQEAEKIGLNVQKLTADAKGKKVRDLIAEDIADAKKLGVEGTPYFLVNNIVVRGALPLELFRDAFEMALEQSKKKK